MTEDQPCWCWRKEELEAIDFLVYQLAKKLHHENLSNHAIVCSHQAHYSLLGSVQDARALGYSLQQIVLPEIKHNKRRKNNRKDISLGEGINFMNITENIYYSPLLEIFYLDF